MGMRVLSLEELHARRTYREARRAQREKGTLVWKVLKGATLGLAIGALGLGLGAAANAHTGRSPVVRRTQIRIARITSCVVMSMSAVP